MKKFIKEFKEFAMGGNILDMAIGVIVGGAFSAVVSSLVADIFTPLIGMIFGSEIDFSDLKLGQIAIGNFINTVITFLLTALFLFSILKAANKAKEITKKQEEEAAAEAAAEIDAEIQLLTEIRDLLQNK